MIADTEGKILCNIRGILISETMTLFFTLDVLSAITFILKYVLIWIFHVFKFFSDLCQKSPSPLIVSVLFQASCLVNVFCVQKVYVV